jgi:hypothetical protein
MVCIGLEAKAADHHPNRVHVYYVLDIRPTPHADNACRRATSAWQGRPT